MTKYILTEAQTKTLINNLINENVYKVYHGTNNEFRNFDFKNSTQGIVWFTDNIDSIKNQEHGGQGNQFIMTRYITINNPAGWDEYEKYGLQQLEDMGYDGVILPQENKTDFFVFSNKNIRAKNPQPIDIQAKLRNKFPNLTIDIYQDDKNKTLTLSRIIVPKELREQGMGTNFMTDLISMADKLKYKIILTPDDSFGGNKYRLQKFYKQFGFIPNKGKNRDFSHREDMYRTPNK